MRLDRRESIERTDVKLSSLFFAFSAALLCDLRGQKLSFESH